jgi:DNA-binding CsgD family transcriptional regulator
VVCSGTVTSAEEAAAALLGAIAGAGLVIQVDAERVLVERLCDDLRRFGPVDYRTQAAPARSVLSAEERILLELLAQGRTLGEAALQANLSRRTADRRVASAREKLGVGSTSEALVRLRRSGRL